MPTIRVSAEAFSKLVDESKELGVSIQDLASKYILDVLGYENEVEDDDAKKKSKNVAIILEEKKAVPLEDNYTTKSDGQYTKKLDVKWTKNE